MPVDTSFIDFTYGSHKASDFNLYRVSSGSRYNDNLIPTLTDKTAEIPGADGMYFFNTYYKQRQFSINFAYDSLTETNLRAVRNWLNGKEVLPLIFDEHPDRQYFAKVTSVPSFKYICFDEPDIPERPSNIVNMGTAASQTTHVIYKGEGSVQFTCYDPFAYALTPTTQTYSTSAGTYSPTSITVGGTAPTPFTITCAAGAPSGATIAMNDNNSNVLGFITLQEAVASNLEWNSNTGMVKGTVNGVTRAINVIGNAMCALPVDTVPRVTVQSMSGYTLTLSFYNRYL